jgi:LacI family transcriptional regulator, galactose operon repressor
VVTVDYAIDHPRIGSVESDTERGALLAVEHLRTRGRSVLGMVSSPSGRTVEEPRQRGFHRAIADLTDDVEHHVVWADETLEGGASGVRQLLERLPAVDGILAYNDVMAIGAMRELEDLGHRVPDDVAVVGVDDVEFSALVRPSLTTVRIDREQMGGRAVDMLMQMRADPDVPPPPRDGRRLPGAPRLRMSANSVVQRAPGQWRRTILPSCSPASSRCSAAG